jgi:FtsH-binding integral membrane protein
MMFIFSSKVIFFGLIIAQLGLVFVLSGMVQKLSAGMATTLLMLYSALTGLTLSSIFLVYTYSSIASTFVVAGGMFGRIWPGLPKLGGGGALFYRPGTGVAGTVLRP